MVTRRTFGLASLAPLLCSGQQVTITPRPKPVPKEQEQKPASIRVSSNLVLIPVTVNDRLNRPVSGLERENFRLYDDKVEQTISQFAMDDEPIAAGLVFDTSGSMGEKLKRSRMAASRVLAALPMQRTSSSWWSSTTSRAWRSD